MALTNKLKAIGDAIREKTNTTDQMTLEQMATAISGITGGGEGSGDILPEEAFLITGDCSYRFANGGWDWYITAFKDKITTKDITSASNMFSYSNLENIPFDINLKEDTECDCSGAFRGSYYINKLPYIKGKVKKFDDLCSSCFSLREIPNDWVDYIDWETLHNNGTSTIAMDGMFASCYSLRRIPDSLIAELYNKATSVYYVPYYGTFSNCYSLDEICNLIVHKETITANMFSSMISGCNRLKKLTFKLQEDGTPYTANWKTQTLDFSSSVGYVGSKSYILNYNSGITVDKEVSDDESYERLKDDPDWFTTNIAYSRYNKTSAINTINSLPDTSAYLATAGGSNTIKFRGSFGSLTDGGAINTLTEEEIAVATAKGWTVTFV